MTDLHLPPFLRRTPQKTSMSDANPVKVRYAIDQAVSLYQRLDAMGQRHFANILDLHPWTAANSLVREKVEAFVAGGNDLFHLNHDMERHREQQKG